jgi:hypothetical protein
MATEPIKINNGSLTVQRNVPGKSDLEISLSDLESVSFERGGEANGASDGTLVLFTKEGDRHTVRVADDEVGKYLKLIYDADKKKESPKADSAK